MSQTRTHLSLVSMIIISLLGCCMEIDISIPSFPSIMSFFEASEAQVQATLSMNFVAFCIAGLFYGPLSESWGRRGLMLFGATCFLIGAVGCVFSYSIEQLMFWRFIQGLGASSAVVLGFAMISDRYSGDQAASYIGKVNAYITIFMATAPIIGSLIINSFTWRANFIAIAIIGLVSWVLLMIGLKETKVDTQPLKFKGVLQDYASLLTNREFLIYASIPNMLGAAYITFVGSAAFYYINTCSLSYYEFAIHQGLIVGSFSVVSFYANKIIAIVGGPRSVKLGMSCSALSMVLMITFAFVYPNTPWLITLSMCVFAVGCVFPMSVTFAQSLEIVPNLKGACSSFIMSSRLLISGGTVALTGLLFDGSIRPVALVNAGAILVSLWLYYKLQKLQKLQTESVDFNPSSA